MDTETLHDAYINATQEFMEIAHSINDFNLDRALEGEWTPRQIIHHMADSDAHGYVRLRQMIAEPSGKLHFNKYDEVAWAQNDTLGYSSLPVTIPLTIIEYTRNASASLIKRLTPNQLTKTCTYGGKETWTIASFIQIYTNHAKDHARQIKHLLDK